MGSPMPSIYTAAMSSSEIYALLLEQQKTIRQLQLHLEALKRMMFEHRPPFVPAFEHQLGAIEASGFLRNADETLKKIERLASENR